MTGPEHYIAAEELLEDVGHARDEDDAARVRGIAQVHATLALAAATAVGIGVDLQRNRKRTLSRFGRFRMFARPR